MDNEYRSWRTLLEDFKIGNISEDDARNYLDEMSYDMTEEEYEKAELKFAKIIKESNSSRSPYYGENREYFENHPESDIERSSDYDPQEWDEEEDEYEDEYEDYDDDDYEEDEEEEYDEDYDDEDSEEDDEEEYEDYDDD